MVNGVKAVILLVVLVGCASTKDELGNSLPLSLTKGTYAGEGPFVEWPAKVGGTFGIIGGAGAAIYFAHGADAGFPSLGGAVGYIVAEPAVGLPFLPCEEDSV